MDLSRIVLDRADVSAIVVPSQRPLVPDQHGQFKVSPAWLAVSSDDFVGLNLRIQT